MKQKFKLKSLGQIVVTMILTDGEKEIEAEATFEKPEEAFRLLSNTEKVDSVELDPEETEESETKFYFIKEEVNGKKEPVAVKREDKIRTVKVIPAE